MIKRKQNEDTTTTTTTERIQWNIWEINSKLDKYWILIIIIVSI